MRPDNPAAALEPLKHRSPEISHMDRAADHPIRKQVSDLPSSTVNAIIVLISRNQ
jgi:hypothetical protein